jgi:hypothetical protein
MNTTTFFRIMPPNAAADEPTLIVLSLTFLYGENQG